MLMNTFVLVGGVMSLCVCKREERAEAIAGDVDGGGMSF